MELKLTHPEFKDKLQALNLSLKNFAELIDTPYSTVAKYGKSNPVPTFVKPFLDLYDKNLKIELVKEEILSLAKKL